MSHTDNTTPPAVEETQNTTPAIVADEQANASPMAPAVSAISAAGDETVTKVLPSGKTAVMVKFKGKHVRKAQRHMSGGDTDEEGFMFVIIAMLTTIDGQPIAPEDLDEMDGQDVISLMGEFSASSFRQ